MCGRTFSDTGRNEILMNGANANPSEPSKAAGRDSLQCIFYPELFDVEGCFERQGLRGAADEDGVLAGQECPSVLGFIEDGQILGIDFEVDGFLFAGFELDFAEADEALGWFLGAGGEAGVDFGDLSSWPRAAVGEGEADLDLVALGNSERSIAVGGVRETETEGEQDRLFSAS